MRAPSAGAASIVASREVSASMRNRLGWRALRSAWTVCRLTGSLRFPGAVRLANADQRGKGLRRRMRWPRHCMAGKLCQSSSPRRLPQGECDSDREHDRRSPLGDEQCTGAERADAVTAARAARDERYRARGDAAIDRVDESDRAEAGAADQARSRVRKNRNLSALQRAAPGPHDACRAEHTSAQIGGGGPMPLDTSGE